MRKQGRRGSGGRNTNLSGFLGATCSAIANRLLLMNALNPQGALVRSMAIPVFRLLARFFRWWSRGWLGQVLGAGWARETYRAGAKRDLTPSRIGDEWAQYKHGNVKLRHPGKS